MALRMMIWADENWKSSIVFFPWLGVMLVTPTASITGLKRTTAQHLWVWFHKLVESHVAHVWPQRKPTNTKNYSIGFWLGKQSQNNHQKPSGPLQILHNFQIGNFCLTLEALSCPNNVILAKYDWKSGKKTNRFPDRVVGGQNLQTWTTTHVFG